VITRIKQDNFHRRQAFGLFIYGLQHGSDLPHIVGRLGDEGCRDQHGSSRYCHLGVVALLKAAAKLGHDARFFVREVDRPPS